MSKIKTIKLVNFKAIDQFEANFNGCTAIVTAGNDKGKTSFLKGIVDRIRFIRPENKVRSGEKQGNGELILDTGEKFTWEFDDAGKDKLIYTDKEGVKQSVTTAIGKRFFPEAFDIDVFLNSSPKDQQKDLQKIVGVDFTDIDKRYTEAYNLRTSKNADSEKFHVKLSQMLKVDKVDFVDLKSLQEKKEKIRLNLNELYKSNKAVNDLARKLWDLKKEEINEEIKTHNYNASQQDIRRDNLYNALENFEHYKYPDVSNLTNWIEITYPKITNKTAEYPTEPDYITEMPDDKDMREIDAQILEASKTNADAQKYADYISYKSITESAKVEAEEADESVKKIEGERKKMVESANFPKGITIDQSGIKVDGYPLDKKQISTSKLYTTALRIASMNIGEVRSLYFDASYLDKNTLTEIQEWATENDFQLLIERPDFDAGEIKYTLLEN